MNRKQIILIGGGGHCKSCIEVVESTNKYEIVGIVDTKDKLGQELLGYKVFACDDDLDKLKEKYDFALITVGQIKSPSLRKKLFKKVKEIGFKLPVIIASTAHVSKYSKIGEGTIIMHQAMVNANVVIGKNNIINTKALIEHDTKIGDFNHISTASVLNGITDSIFIGINSVINKNIKDAGIYVGNPIRKIR